MLTVFNKTDLLDEHTLARLRAEHPGALFISVHTGAGLDELLGQCEALAADDTESAEVLIPHSRYDVVARLHAIGHVKKQESLDDGTRLTGRFPKKFSSLYTPFIAPAPAKPAKKAAKTVRKKIGDWRATYRKIR
jgi:GTP-binding protein HflX